MFSLGRDLTKHFYIESYCNLTHCSTSGDFVRKKVEIYDFCGCAENIGFHWLKRSWPLSQSQKMKPKIAKDPKYKINIIMAPRDTQKHPKRAKRPHKRPYVRQNHALSHQNGRCGSRTMAKSRTKGACGGLSELTVYELAVPVNCQ